jgi:ATP-binding cassette subfamily B protein
MTCDSILENISAVFQRVYLFNDTIYNNIKFGKPTATKEEIISAAKAARCHDFITKLPDGYDTLVNSGGNSLSGGEKQRISIARAILKNAPIVILDEATSSVDPDNEYFIQQAIDQLVKGKTLIVIAHRLHTIKHADQIIVLENGKIEEIGKHDELISKNGIYYNLWNKRNMARSWKIVK